MKKVILFVVMWLLVFTFPLFAWDYQNKVWDGIYDIELTYYSISYPQDCQLCFPIVIESEVWFSTVNTDEKLILENKKWGTINQISLSKNYLGFTTIAFPNSPLECLLLFDNDSGYIGILTKNGEGSLFNNIILRYYE